MKILEKGSLPEESIYRCRCCNCNTLYEFQRKEAVYVPEQRDGDYLTTKCPLCNRRNSTAVKEAWIK